MELQTPRLLLRPWEESDAEALYELAKDPDVGPAAGWNVHKDADESREIIRTILSAPGTFAILGRRDGQLRGSCGFFPTRAQGAEAGELEIGYWVGKPFWGRGIAPEAVEAAAAHAKELPHVQVRGLMTIPPAGAARDENMVYFEKVHALYVDINQKMYNNELDYLSMGMSGDFADAIRAGSNMVRVGTAIFGARDYTK